MMADYNGMDAMFDRVVERRKEYLREKRRKRNVAAIVDFASNLLVAAGNMNGARLKSPAPLLPEYEKAYRDAHERLTGFMRDFNGRKAHSQLWNPLSKRSAKERSVTGIPYAANLLSGSFDNALNRYKESGSFKNLSKK